MKAAFIFNAYALYWAMFSELLDLDRLAALNIVHFVLICLSQIQSSLQPNYSVYVSL